MKLMTLRKIQSMKPVSDSRKSNMIKEPILNTRELTIKINKDWGGSGNDNKGKD